ncbi:MAG: sulfatase [Eubacteriales bacterium]
MKNLVYIFADQWRRSSVGFQGEPIQTPNFDSFAKNNIYCTNAVSSCPLCSPYRASLITGKYARNTGVVTNCKPSIPMRLADEEISIATVLKDQGYATSYIGKWHMDTPEERTHAFPTCGATGWDAYTPPGKGRQGFDFWHSYGAANKHNSGQHYWENSPEKIVTDKWSPEHETDVALDFVSKNKEKPFAFFMSWNPPHPPYEEVPQKYLDLYPEDVPMKGNVDTTHIVNERSPVTGNPLSEEEVKLRHRQYYAAISGLDEQFGRIIAYLKENNLLENTYVVVSSDHGDMLGSHGYSGKHIWYEESLGIPFLIGGPSLPSGCCETVIGTEDVMPTLLDLMGISCPNTVDGESCGEALRTLVTQKEKFAYLGCFPGATESYVKDGRNVIPQDFGWRGIRSLKHTFAAFMDYDCDYDRPIEYYFYDLEADPLQMNPLRENFKDNPIALQMYQDLKKILEKQQDGFLQFMKER